MLSAIAFDLTRRDYPKYSLHLPRFAVGRLVMRLDLDLAVRDTARGQVVSALEEQRSIEAVRSVLAWTAGEMLTGFGAGVGVPINQPDPVTRPFADWLTRRLPKKVMLGRFQDWYGHQDLGLSHDPIDVLVDLNRSAAHDDEDSLARVDELLWRAFLADLRAEFDRGRHAGERSLNCVVLLDNADSELGRRFLGQLVRLRRQRAVESRDDADPMTVVATSRGALLSRVADADRMVVDREALRSVTDLDWSRRWWLGVRLTALTEDEVDRTTAGMGLTWGDTRQIARMVIGVTGGHPAAIGMMLDATARSRPRRWLDMAALLGHVGTAEDGTSEAPVEELMLDRLLIGVAEPTRRDLVTCAPARCRDQALALATRDGMLANSLAGYEATVDPLLWPDEPMTGIPLLRRLLLRQLAAREGGETGDALSWTGVHSTLRQLCAEAGDEADELFYALADGHLDLVVSRLGQRLGELSSADWFDLVADVTVAPYRTRNRTVPIDEARALVGAADLDARLTPVGQLVAGLQITADPFTDSRRSAVHLLVADAYAEVARLFPGGPHAVFLDAARRHRHEADWWD
ncbi:MAG: hypothetical protein WCA46_25370 [Actinocatenispora sp.]